MTSSRSRGSVLILGLIVMLLLFSLTGSLLALTAARCRAIARESRRAQALALAESAVAAAQVGLAAGELPSSLSGALATGRYSARVTRIGDGRVVVRAVGEPRSLVGGAGAVMVETTLARRGGRWRVSAWREIQP
jgi:Tfp pilus assembly protein PilX